MSDKIGGGRSEAGGLPFLLNLVEDVDEATYGEAIRESEALQDTYDPVTQTSRVPIYAGTSRTYTSTWTGTWSGTDKHDDSKVSDD